MGAETILIAAFSGRALAQSARRAGFEPLVVDCFADEDMVSAAAGSRLVQASLQGGFPARAITAALDDLVASARSKPIGLVLGAGFEGTPKLVASLSRRFELIGNSGDVIQRAKEPASFFAALRRLGIPHPETRTAGPHSHAGWLVKRIGGSGGMHVKDCSSRSAPTPRRYFQRKIPGEAISALGMLGPESSAFAFSRQWTSPSARHPYRYGGCAGSAAVDEDLEGRLIDMSMAVASELALKGLVSFDYLVSDGEPFLIEVNPRPGASLDIFEDGQGTLLSAHIEGCRPGGDPAAILASQWAPPIARASAYLYADRGSIDVHSFDWPDWVSDRPRRGSAIARSQPVATVIADGQTMESAEALCRERLCLLEDMLYQKRSPGKEAH